MGNWNSGRRPMGRPKPTALKMLRGNPGKRPLNDREPQPARADDAFDQPPSALDDDRVAAEEWQRLAPLLRQCGMVSNAERGVLLALCQQWSCYLDAHDRIRLEGMLVTSDKTGEPKRNPYISIADHALTQCLRLWAELGLTPSSRSRIVALPEVAPKSKWRELA